MMDNNEILNSLIRILEKSFYEGYNNEQPLDRKLFAQFFINNGVVLREI